MAVVKFLLRCTIYIDLIIECRVELCTIESAFILFFCFSFYFKQVSDILVSDKLLFLKAWITECLWSQKEVEQDRTWTVHAWMYIFMRSSLPRLETVSGGESMLFNRVTFLLLLGKQLGGVSPSLLRKYLNFWYFIANDTSAASFEHREELTRREELIKKCS